MDPPNIGTFHACDTETKARLLPFLPSICYTSEKRKRAPAHMELPFDRLTERKRTIPVCGWMGMRENMFVALQRCSGLLRWGGWL